MPPSSRARLKDATELYQDFTGHDGSAIDVFELPEYDTGLKIGTLDGVLYTTVRDGETEKYIHRFKKSSRPLLATSHDGKQLYIVGGRYTFTDRGIVDE